MHKIFVSLTCFVLLVALAHADAQDERTTLSVEQAKVFAQDTSGQLQLDRLVMLSPEAAKELARFEGWLSLNGLTSLSKETAAALGQHKGPLHLNGLANVPLVCVVVATLTDQAGAIVASGA